MANIELSDFEVYCPVCTCCLEGDPDECAECLSPRPSPGWEDLKTTSYTYLGKVLDTRYIVDRFLGAGATGDVYRGVGSRIRRPFALKIVDSQRYKKKELETEIQRRLELEVEAMSRLRNPHVVNVYESFQIRDHVFVVVMDYVEGVTLQEKLDRIGRLQIDDAVEIVRQVANGLQEAHQRGIIHRDLKPENIMIEQMPAAGVFARILDFGIAYMVDSVRQTTGFRGTPLYASPEQCKSDGEINARSDVYSLGCVFFHCLTGHPPFEGERALTVMEAHLDDPIPSIYEDVSRNEVPQVVADLIEDMLAKDPSERPEDCGEVVSRLDALDLRASAPDQAPPEPAVPPPPTVRREVASSVSNPEVVEPTPDKQEATHAEDDDLPLPYGTRQRVVRRLASIPLPGGLTSNSVTASALGPGGDFAVVADRSGSVHLVGVKSHMQAMTFGGIDNMITAVCINPNRGDVYGGGFDSSVQCWNLDRTTGLPRKVVDVGDRVFAIDVDQRGERLAIGTERGRVLLHDLRTSRLREIHKAKTPVSAIRFIPGSERLFLGCWEGQLRTVHIPSKEVLAELEPLSGAAIAAAVHPHDSMAAVVEDSGQLRVLNLSAPSAFLSVEASFANLKALSFAPDGSLSGLGVGDGELELWLVRNQNVFQHLADKSSVVMD